MFEIMVNWGEIFEVSTWDVILLSLLAVMAFRWWRRRNQPEIERPVIPKVDPTPMMDLTLADLKKYNGVDDEHIFFALNGTIYDVSRGRGFYGPEGPYGALAGHDATRALSTMDVKAVKDEWDDHEGLTAVEKDSALEWETSFKFKYPTVGKLVKDGEEKTDYEGKMAAVQA